MKDRRFSISKGRTIGIEAGGRTRYQKIGVSFSAKLADDEDLSEKFKESSQFLEDRIHDEIELIKSKILNK